MGFLVGNFNFQHQVINWITSQVLSLKYYDYFMFTYIVRVVWFCYICYLLMLILKIGLFN